MYRSRPAMKVFLMFNTLALAMAIDSVERHRMTKASKATKAVNRLTTSFFAVIYVYNLVLIFSLDDYMPMSLSDLP